MTKLTDSEFAEIRLVADSAQLIEQIKQHEQDRNYFEDRFNESEKKLAEANISISKMNDQIYKYQHEIKDLRNKFAATTQQLAALAGSNVVPLFKPKE